MAGAEAGAGVGAWGGCAASPQNNTTANSLDDIMSEQLASHLQRKEDIRFAKNTAAAHNILQDENTPAKLVQQLQTGPESEFCDSDLIIAKMLQCQFDQEYKDQVKNSEKKRNGLYKYKIPLEHSVQEAEEDTVQREYERDWDNFDDNEKDFAEIPRCGYKLQDGKMVTKHDTTLTGRRNASKVMAFPPEFRTGDAAAFDMQLPNRVFNSLKAHSRSEQSKKNKMLNRKESHATAEMGIDEPTRLLLYKFINNGMLQSINGIIATGKESIVLHAEGDPSYPEKLIPSECAIKVFKTTLNEFKTRDKYIKDDYRFKDRFCKLNPRKVIHMWAEKEMHNLMRMQKLGINCPEVICLKKHILILSFIGKDNMAAQKIKEAKLTDAQWILAYEEIVEAMNKMYNEGHLIHADLSEYNILWHKERCWFIDVSQSVEPNHPSGLEFLLRDCTNISHVSLLFYI